MKRRRLFFIGLISAITTIISLNIAFGRSGYYNHSHSYYGRYYHCNDRYNNKNSLYNEKEHKADSLNN